MAKRVIENLDLKVKLTLEYFHRGGIQRIPDPNLLQDFIEAKYDDYGNIDPDTVTTRMNAFMMGILHMQRRPPFYSPTSISEYESLLQKSYYFEQVNINTIEEFDKIYDEYSAKRNTLFRGQREAKWRLYSTLQRHWIQKRLFDTEKSYQQFLEKLVDSGIAEYSEQIKSILREYHEDVFNHISVLGFLQHYGCPTPLLDWTFSFRNALFFGIDHLSANENPIEIDDYFSVYHIAQKFMEDGSMRKMILLGLEEANEAMHKFMISKITDNENDQKLIYENIKDRKAYDNNRLTGSGLISHMTSLKHMIKGAPLSYFSDNDNESGIIFSLNNSKNILNQFGAFTWNADPTKPFELVGYEIYEGDKEEYRFCSCLNIHKSLSEHARKRLERDGITEDYIYPTKDINTWGIFDKSQNS